MIANVVSGSSLQWGTMVPEEWGRGKYGIKGAWGNFIYIDTDYTSITAQNG